MTEISESEIKKLKEFDNHELIFPLDREGSNLSGFIVIHRRNPPTPSFGATRLWHYESSVDALKDALRLSRLMSYKAALAGLKCGGAKGVIATPKFFQSKKKILGDYAARINELHGQFITGTDAGLEQKDLEILKDKSMYIVGLHADATKFTGLGVLYSIELVLEKIFGSSDMSERTFAIQGLGKVGGEVLKLIYGKAKKIYVSEIDKEKIAQMSEFYPRIEVVPADDIYGLEVDIFSPCALDVSIDSESIKGLSCRAIVGGANNQLESEEIGKWLHKIGILYTPDYVVNAGGLITVFDEFENSSYDQERVLAKVRNIRITLEKILAESDRGGLAPSLVADRMARGVIDSHT